MSIISNQLEYLENVNNRLKHLLGLLLEGDDAASGTPNPGEEKAEPIDINRFNAVWKDLFAPLDADLQNEINSLFVGLSRSLFEVYGGDLLDSLNHAVEKWLRRFAPHPPLRRSKIRVEVIWFLIAVHNWLWWRQDAEKDPETKEKKDKANKDPREWVRQPLALLVEKDDLRTGDFLAMHLLATKLRESVNPPPSRPVRIQLSSQGQVRDVSRKSQADQDALPRALEASLDELSLTSPFSQLYFSGLPKRPEREIANENVLWFKRFMEETGGAGGRLYLISHLGNRLAQPSLEPKQIRDLLRTLQNVDERIGKVRTVEGQSAWYSFLSGILWSSLEGLESEDREENRIWARWCEGYPEVTTPAQWLGRIACFVEEQSRWIRPFQFSELVWQWCDLAGAAVKNWIMNPGYRVLCLGQWLDGFFGASTQTEPYFRQGRRVIGMALPQVIAHWEASSRRELNGQGTQDLSVEETGHLWKQLEVFGDRLNSSSGYKACCPEIMESLPVDSGPAPVEGRSDPAGEEEATRPLARLFEYGARANLELDLSDIE